MKNKKKQALSRDKPAQCNLTVRERIDAMKQRAATAQLIGRPKQKKR